MRLTFYKRCPSYLPLILPSNKPHTSKKTTCTHIHIRAIQATFQPFSLTEPHQTTMAPINQPSYDPPTRARHSLFRRDLHDGSVVSLIITAIILTILVTGISIWLWRRTYSKVVGPCLDRHRSSKYRLPDLRPGLSRKRTEPILPSYRQSMRERSNSDALWSAAVYDQDVGSDDGSDDYTPLPRYSSRKSFRYLSMSLTSGPAFKPLDMDPIQEGCEPQQPQYQRPMSSDYKKEPVVVVQEVQEGRPGMPRRSMSETSLRTRQTFENQMTPSKHSPLRSHPVNTEALRTHGRSSGSWDGAQRKLQRQRSSSRIGTREELL